MASKKKSAGKKAVRRKTTKNADKFVPPTWPGERTSSNGTRYEYQLIRNPYVPGAREKMLEKREKLTLEAFRIAYENHHRRKSS